MQAYLTLMIKRCKISTRFFGSHLAMRVRIVSWSSLLCLSDVGGSGSRSLVEKAEILPLFFIMIGHQKKNKSLFSLANEKAI